jgi:hypothetical protein
MREMTHHKKMIDLLDVRIVDVKSQSCNHTCFRNMHFSSSSWCSAINSLVIIIELTAKWRYVRYNTGTALIKPKKLKYKKFLSHETLNCMIITGKKTIDLCETRWVSCVYSSNYVTIEIEEIFQKFFFTEKSSA